MVKLNPKHFGRYYEIIKLLWKYGGTDLVNSSDLPNAIEMENAPPADEEEPSKPEELTNDLEKMGPVFIKLGQLLSTRSDLLPPEYLEALTRLQDGVGPVPYEEIHDIIQEELGVRISKAFSEFTEEPLATASIGQVHRAKLRDGREVAVKVQRPGVRKQIIEDLDALTDLSDYLHKHSKAVRESDLKGIVDTLYNTLLLELDYRQEAMNAMILKKNLDSFTNFVVPEPVEDYTTSKVLTMEYISGTKITDISETILVELDRVELAESLFNIYLHQVLVDGVFHSDPHPGNLLLTRDHKICLMDFGMVTRVAPEMQSKLLKLLLAVSEKQGEETARIAIEIGEPAEHYNEAKLRKETIEVVKAYSDMPVEQMQAGQIVMGIQQIAASNGLRLPQEVNMLGKTLMNLDKVVTVLDPKFQPNNALRAHASEMMQKQTQKKVSLGSIYNSLMEATELAQNLPHRINRFTDLISSNQLKVDVNAFDEKKLMEGMQKIANRITTGLILAAMIIGASLMMHLKSEAVWTLFGYPGIAMIFFLFAGGTGAMLVWQVVWKDDKAENPHVD